MKRSISLILGLLLGLAGCAGGSNSSTKGSISGNVTTETGVTSDLPVYPGATKVTDLSLTVARCGHKSSAVTYIVKDDVKTVADWYAARIPGGARVAGIIPVAGGTSIAMTGIFDPSGTRAVTVSKTHFAANIPLVDQNIENAAAVHVVLQTVEPGLSSSEMQDAEAMIGGDPAARQRVLAKTKCGPSSLPSSGM